MFQKYKDPKHMAKVLVVKLLSSYIINLISISYNYQLHYLCSDGSSCLNTSILVFRNLQWHIVLIRLYNEICR